MNKCVCKVLIALSLDNLMSVQIQAKREQKKSQGRLNSKQKSNVATENKVQCYHVPIQLMYFVLAPLRHKRKKKSFDFLLKVVNGRRR